MSIDFNLVELKDDSLDFNFGEITTISILEGSSNNFIAIWADLDTGLNSGKMFVSSKGTGAAFNIINIGTNKVVDYYALNHKGSTGQYLEADDVVDIACS